MINKFKFKFGSSPNQDSLEVNAANITLFVGPNNSGKSLVLREFYEFSRTGHTLPDNLILDDLEFDVLENPEDEILEFVTWEDLTTGRISFGNPYKGGSKFQGTKESLIYILSNPNKSKTAFAFNYLSSVITWLSGLNRLDTIRPKERGNLKEKVPSNILTSLFVNDTKRFEARRILFDAFQKYLVIDPTNSSQLSISFSDSNPNPDLERSLNHEALEFHKKNTPIEKMSDGVRAFTGILISVIADSPKVIFIDEPEAFLHPSLSFKLGKEIGNILKTGSAKRLFVSTHSANFLMGCIQSGASVDIVRLTYSNSVPTARLLSNNKISRLIKHPLLRSVGTLNGLFYEYVIVTESDSDRAFYQEINERLLQFSPERGIPNCLFLNAQNKQTIHEIVKPLREMGIPSVGIVDIDVIKEGGVNWSNFTNCGFLPEVTKQETETSRNRIKSKFDEKGIDFKRNGGVNVLDDADREACNNLFERLEEYGMFIVRNGELESWLKPLGVTGHSPKWLIEIFERMGDDSNSVDYIKPSNDDVWEFMGRIKKWFTNPNRKGIPN